MRSTNETSECLNLSVVDTGITKDDRWNRDYYNDMGQAIRMLKKLDARLKKLHPEVSFNIKRIL